MLSNTCTKTLENENIFIQYKQKYSFQHSFENLFATSSYKLNVKLTLVLQSFFFNRKSRTSLGQDFYFFFGGGLLFFILFSRTVVRRRLVVTSALCQCKQSLSLRPSSNKAPHALILYPSLSKYWIKTSLFSLILNASYNILYGESEKKITVKVKIQY